MFYALPVRLDAVVWIRMSSCWIRVGVNLLVDSIVVIQDSALAKDRAAGGTERAKSTMNAWGR